MLRKKLEEKKYEFEKRFLGDFAERFAQQYGEYKDKVKRLRSIRRELKELLDEFSPYIEEKRVRQLIEHYEGEPEVQEHNKIFEQTRESIKKLYLLGDEYKTNMHEELPQRCNEIQEYLKKKIEEVLSHIPVQEEINRDQTITKEEPTMDIKSTDANESTKEQAGEKAKILLDKVIHASRITDDIVEEFIALTYEEQYKFFDLCREMKQYIDMQNLFMVHFAINLYSKETLGAKFINEKKPFTKAIKIKKLLERMKSNKPRKQKEETVTQQEPTPVIEEKGAQNVEIHEETGSEDKKTHEEQPQEESQNIFMEKEEGFKIISVTQETDDKNIPTEQNNTLPVIFDEEQKKEIIPGLAKTIEMPKFNTIEEMVENAIRKEMEKGTEVEHKELEILNKILPKETQEKLSYLEKKTSEINFKKLTLTQIEEISEYVKKIEKMSNLEIVNLMKDYVGSMTHIRHDYNTYKNLDKKQKKIIEEEYIRGPTSASLEDMAQRTLQGMNKKHNVDILRDGNRFHFASPVTTLLVFLKVQKDIRPERTKKISSVMIAPFHQILDRHTEFTLKLIFDEHGKKNVRAKKEFFGEEKHEEIKKHLKILRSIMYNTELTKSITPKQHKFVVELFEKYKDTIRVIIMTDNEGQYKNLIDGKAERKKGDVDMACREILEKFDDGITSRKSQRITTKKSFPTISEMINYIYVRKETVKSKPMEQLIKSGIMFDKLKEFVQEYLTSTSDERENIKKQKIAAFKKEYDYLSPCIIERFFSSLDQYT